MNVGIVGTGGMGRVHARQYSKMPEIELFAFDSDADRAAAYSEATGAILVDSYEDLLQSVDAIDICLPTHLHLEFASQSLRSGKPTLCEKPMCRSVAEARELALLVKDLGVPFMPAQVVRFFPEFRKAHDLVTSGAIGRPAAIRTRRCGKHPQGAGGWFANRELSGGVLLDLAIHDFDWIRWTFGEVERVFSQTLPFSDGLAIDYSLTTLTLASGAIAHVEGSWPDPAGFRAAFEVAGSEGFFEYDSRLSVPLRTTTASGSAIESPMLPSDDPYFLQIGGFLDGIATGIMPVTAEDGMQAVAIAEAAINSAKTGLAIEPRRN
jgi:predicted dehydrogenase